MAEKAVEYLIKGNAKQAIAEMKNFGGSIGDVVKKSKELHAAGVSDQSKFLAQEYRISQATARAVFAKGAGLGGASNGSGQGGESAGTIKMLKAAFGEESAFGNTMKILRGGGAIAGFAIAGNVLADWTTKARELQEAFASGKMSAGDMVEELAKGLPVIGGFWQAGRNIKEMAASWMGIETDEKYAKRIRDETAIDDLKSQAMSAALKARQASQRDWDNQFYGAQARSAVAGLEGWEGENAQATQAAQAKQRELALKAEAQKQAIDDRIESEAKGLRDKAGDDEKLKARAEDRIRQIRAQGEKDKAEVIRNAKAVAEVELAATIKEQQAKQQKLAELTQRWIQDLGRQQVDLQQQANATYLQAQGRGFEAEMAQLYSQNEERKRVFRQQLQDRLKEIPAAMREEAKRTGEAVAQAMDKATVAQAQARYGQTLKGMAGQVLSALQEGGGTVAAEAQATAKRMALQDEYSTAQSQAQAILNDPNATSEQKLQAVQLLGNLVSTAGSRMQAAASAPALQLVGAEQSLLGTGMSERWASEYDPQKQTHEISKQSLDVLQKLAGMFQTFLSQNETQLSQSQAMLAQMGILTQIPTNPIR